MDKAYDSILCSEIDALEIVKTSYCKGSDYFRYKCLCCGEEVYLAAADSIVQTPHFRHRKGNNDTECEAYLGTPGAIERFVSERKRNQERISFYFNNDRKTFELGISFQNEELKQYGSHNIMLELKSRTAGNDILSVPVNDTVFVPNSMRYFTISTYSRTYTVSINRKIYSFEDVIRDMGRLTFFRTRLLDRRASRTFSKLLYTDTEYIVICEDKSCIEQLLSFSNIECFAGIETFCTMEKQFYSAEISILDSEYHLNLFLFEQNLQIEKPESLDVLWPPIFIKESDYACEYEKVYVCSSFPIVRHGNTNAECSELDNSVYRVTELELNERIVVCEKNVDFSIVKSEQEQRTHCNYEVEIIYSDKWIAKDDYDYFLFDQDGCRQLSFDEKIYLIQEDRILGYKSGHLKIVIKGRQKQVESADEIINDIVKYYPKTDLFDPDEFEGYVLSKQVISYLEKCRRTGEINTVVKKYIKEDLL